MQSEFKALLKRFLLIFAKGENLRILFANQKTPNKYTEPHLLVDIFPLTPEATDICMAGARNEWLVTTSVRIRDGQGEDEADSIADRLVSYCSPENGVLKQLCGECGDYRFIRLPDPRPPVPTDGWYSIPVENRLELLT